MDEITLRLPGMWDDGPDVSPVLLLKKGPERRRLLRNIVIETLRAVSPQRPTARNLQKLCKIRRKTFLILLRDMLDSGLVKKYGSGAKGDPHRYQVECGERS